MSIAESENKDQDLVSSLSYNDNVRQHLSVIANTIRGLTIDAVQKAGSGHAGTPMGCAELGAYLYGYFLTYNSSNPHWINRDRFILSAGHASMLQYSCLHMAGYNLSIDDLKKFRQINSKTPSHPQYGTTPGVETTTGLDGQGIAHAVGQALGLKLLNNRFNRPGFNLFDSKIVVLAGDGCFMEGISHEACSLAGHLNLNNLIVIKDSNDTCLDGFVSDSCSENTMKRYEAYGWDVYEINGHDFDEIHRVFFKLKQSQNKPALVIAKTIIGKGIATLAGSYLVHSGSLNHKDYLQAKIDLGFSTQEFYVPKEAYLFFEKKIIRDKIKECKWNELFSKWTETYPDLHEEFKKMADKWIPEDLENQLWQLSIPELISGRKASHTVLNYLGDLLPDLYGGSADLARSDMTHMDRHAVILPNHFFGKNIKYGVREFGMAAIAIGLSQTKMFTPFIGTFLAFSDYMLSAIRMAALMKLPIIYQLTHDSIFLGQDGPTHQPIEHLAHLRSIPNLQVIRPADKNEIKMAWLAALQYPGPTAIVLSKQDLPLCSRTCLPYAEGLGRGAYIIKDVPKPLHFTLIATGSEVSLALAVAKKLESKNYAVRVLSMPCWTLFDNQTTEYQESLLGKDSGEKISIEAASNIGWHKYILNGKTIHIDVFGKSATARDLAEEFGFTVEKIVKRII